MRVHNPDGSRYVFPHSQASSERGIIDYDLLVAGVNPDWSTIIAWCGKNHPNQAEIAQAIAQIKCFSADAIDVELNRLV